MTNCLSDSRKASSAKAEIVTHSRLPQAETCNFAKTKAEMALEEADVARVASSGWSADAVRIVKADVRQILLRSVQSPQKGFLNYFCMSRAPKLAPLWQSKLSPLINALLDLIWFAHMSDRFAHTWMATCLVVFF